MINVLITTESRYPCDRKTIRERAVSVLEKHGVRGKAEVEVEVVGDRKMKELHARYIGEEKTTDVLSFPLEDNSASNSGFVRPPDNVLRLGTVVVSYPQALRQAIMHNVLVDDEIGNLVEHGLLHLLGIHHE